jgi:hypothetical protein
VKSLSARSAELPLANQLSQHVANLRVTLCQVDERQDYVPGSVGLESDDEEKPSGYALRRKYEVEYAQFKHVLDQYTEQLDTNRQRTEMGIGDDTKEREQLAKIQTIIDRIETYDNDDGGVDWLLEGGTKVAQLRDDVEELRKLEERASDRGLRELKLNASLNAADFYQKAGYVAQAPSKYRLLTGVEIACVPMLKRMSREGDAS